jgi:hypothetical protein
MDLGTVQHNLDHRYATCTYCSGGRSISVEELHDLQCRGQRLLVALKAYSKRFEDRYRKMKTYNVCMNGCIIVLYCYMKVLLLLTLLFACACC